MSETKALLRRAILDDLADQLSAAWPQPGSQVALSQDQFPHDRAEAYYVQDRMHQLLGERVAGWKVGATSQKMRELDGHEDVIPGRIFISRNYVGTRFDLPFAKFPNSRIETEFAFCMTASPALRDSPWTAKEMEGMMIMHPAIEIIGTRFIADGASKSENSLLVVADNGGGVAFVFGDPIEDWQDIDFQNHNINLTVSDGPPAENFLGDMRCVPSEAVADLVNHLAERGEVLRAGDYVSTGAATVPQPFGEGDIILADFGMLGQIELNFVGGA